MTSRMRVRSRTETDSTPKSGAKSKGGSYRSPTAQLCVWHRYGKPPHAPAKFFAKNCLKCEEKLAAGLVSATDPSPREVWLKTNSGGRLKWGYTAT